MVPYVQPINNRPLRVEGALLFGRREEPTLEAPPPSDMNINLGPTPLRPRRGLTLHLATRRARTSSDRNVGPLTAGRRADIISGQRCRTGCFPFTNGSPL